MTAEDQSKIAGSSCRSTVPDAWRGQCLQLFARAERCVAETLECAQELDAKVPLRHLAGQRLKDFSDLAASNGTLKEVAALTNAIDRWRLVEEKRLFLAHGVSLEARDKSGEWVVLLDTKVYSAKQKEQRRWTVTQDEAVQFQAELTDAFKALSSQAGQFRRRLKAS